MKRLALTDISLKVWAVIVFAFLFAPIAVIIIYSFNEGRLLVSWDQFGFGSFAAIVTKPAITDAVLVSIQTGFIAALIATALGTMAGVALARRAGKWAPAFLILLVLVTVTPEIVDAVSLLPWMVFLGQDVGLSIFDNGIVRLVVGHSLFATAVVAYIVRSRLVGIDESLEEAAADLYAPPFKRFTQITLPLVMPAVLAGGLLSFTLSLDNTIVSAFVQVSGSTPWPVYVLSAVRTGLRPEIAAVSTIMLLLTLAALGLVAYVLRRAGDSATDIAKTVGGG
ncbi:ABC transporter permease [Salinibacterium sp. NSLL150]|uniref:ABC transporter permease n=1 Tax=unclassified Salinibacterium TaxID=2632331 RepID=UPI0018CC9FF7|nr:MULTISPECIES: ABC transporter permease [unclassified Salinibacterium]MBH0097628.1 ABC transporter permease [Salinibacterium sp. NSLL35]MBH0100383.1 ABC transporter permease [Salinibacterium sp. NSLL150]MBH0103142.1 ABC transporter permease [Salinibacterium sp. NSLL16]MBH0105903.1 ABC transporter permease [Salinibacterium sp. NSLL17]MBH0110326.1 ABC transporter permease [Salinibacterium sp. NG22]